MGTRGGGAFLGGHEVLNQLVRRAGKAVQAAGGDGSTQLVERQRGGENLDSFAQMRIVETFGSQSSEVFGRF